jgi:hypothetical protein
LECSEDLILLVGQILCGRGVYSVSGSVRRGVDGGKLPPRRE